MRPPDVLAQIAKLTDEQRFGAARQLLLTLKAHFSEAEFSYNLGQIAHQEGDIEQALAHFERAVQLRPEMHEFHWGLALALLTMGDYARGWREYEHRLKVAHFPLRRNFEQPQWTGTEELTGKTILLHAEGGFGDALQFCRYVPLVLARGASVLLECQPALLSLLRTMPGIKGCYSRGQPLPPFDFHSALQSLPCALKTTLASIPADVPYLTPPADRARHWREILGRRGKLRVGLAWCGSGAVWPKRSRTLATFSPLASVEEFEFHSFQVGPSASEERPAGFQVIDHSRELYDFAEIGALALAMDLIITVDTSYAHLAGALGRPVWVLLPHAACFRYLLDRDDSPWYPTMRLFRQKRGTTDWAPAVVEMRTQLHILANELPIVK